MFSDMSWTIVLCICCFLSTSYATTCMPARIYGDHMVLQREPHGAVLWGYTDPVFSVNVTFKGVNYTSKGSPGAFGPDTGVWQVVLPPQPAGGPVTIDVTCFDDLGNTARSQLVDVLFGDIWICSGQSNMVLPVWKVKNGDEELAASVNYPNIRMLSVRHEQSPTPLYDTDHFYHEWSRPNPEALGVNTDFYFSAVCWFYARDLYDTYKIPMGMISSNWGGTAIHVWSSSTVISACGNSSTMKDIYIANNRPQPHEDSVLWNAMIHPFLNMTIKGVIWYQGESNTLAPDSYRCLFRTMISDWRQRWFASSAQQTDPFFPFGFVQLSTSKKPLISEVNNFTTLRWHQTDDVGYVPNARLPSVFMAVALDLSDLDSPWGIIHPRYKQDVGARLARAARGVAYQNDQEENLIYQGPFPTNFTVDSQAGTIEVHYNNEGSGPIKIVGSLTNTFEVCCSNTTTCQANDVWIGADVVGLASNVSIIITYTCLCLEPVAIRYLWRDYACTYKQCTVYNEFLPAPPFLANLYTLKNAPENTPKPNCMSLFHGNDFVYLLSSVAICVYIRIFP